MNERDEEFEEEDEAKLPGMTVGHLRRAIEGVDDDLPVLIRGEDFTGGIVSAAPEDNCGGEAFVLDCSDDDEDFCSDDEDFLVAPSMGRG